MEKLNSAGGHIAVCLLLILVGLGAAWQGIPHGSELVSFGLGVLARSMMDRDRGRRARGDGRLARRATATTGEQT